MKVNEILKEIKKLEGKDLLKFKKQFDKYCEEIIIGLGGAVSENSTPATEVEAKTETATEKVVEVKAEAEVKVEAKVEEVKTEAETKTKAKTNKKKNKDSQWNQFFKSVRESGVKHGEMAPEGSNILAVATKKSDKCVAAALVNHRGIATNVVYSPTYKYPVVFAKVTMGELEKIKKSIMDKFPEDADIKKIGVNATANGSEDNFYYDEIEEGNFCYRFKREDGNIVYFGYIVDKNICFYRNSEGTMPMIDMSHFFMPKWGTKKSKDNCGELKDAVLSLIDRAFNDDCKTVIEKKDSKVKEEKALSLSEEEEKNRKLKIKREEMKKRKEKKMQKDLESRKAAEEREKQQAFLENNDFVKELQGGRKEVSKADGTVIIYNESGIKERETLSDGTTILYKPDGSFKRKVLPRKESERQFRG